MAAEDGMRAEDRLTASGQAPPAVAEAVPPAAGDHVCVLFRGGDRDRLLAPFLVAGLRDGVPCLLLAADETGRACRDLLVGHVDNADELHVVTPEGWLRDGALGCGRPPDPPVPPRPSDPSIPSIPPDAPPGSPARGPAPGGAPLGRLAADMSWARPLGPPPSSTTSSGTRTARPAGSRSAPGRACACTTSTCSAAT